MEAEILIKELETHLQAAVKHLEDELRAVRSNRPSVQLIEDIKVDYYGQPLTVKQLGSLAIQPPRDIAVSVWDKNAVGAVSKAIEAAKAGFSVSTDGNAVRVALPPLTDERRAELIKLIKKMTEETRIVVRHYRDDIIKKLKFAEDEKKVNEDQVFRTKEQIQKAVDQCNDRVEKALDGKIREISE